MAILKSSTKFIFGIVLIFCGWVICFDPSMLIFGIPFFLLGTIIIMFSNKSIATKILIVGIPIVLWVIGFRMLMNAIEKDMKEKAAQSADTLN